MVLNFFTGVVVMLMIVGLVTAIFDSEKKRCNKFYYTGTEKYKNAINKIADIMIHKILGIAIIIFCIINIIIFIYAIVTKNVLFIIISIMFMITFVFYLIFEYTDKFETITEIIFCILAAAYMCSMIFFFLFQAIAMQNITTDVRKVDTIKILELKEVPYTNVSGTRYYIRSEPSLAYYYDIATDNGGSTTKVIDGYNNYVERCEDDIYKEDPHIDVLEVVQKYTTGYGHEGENIIKYEYYIYIPKGGTYFIDKE